MLKLPTCSPGTPLDLIASETLRWKVQEPVLLLGKQRFQTVDIRIRAQGGGHVSQIYAIRQAIAKGLVAFYQKCRLFLLKQSAPVPLALALHYSLHCHGSAGPACCQGAHMSAFCCKQTLLHGMH